MIKTTERIRPQALGEGTLQSILRAVAYFDVFQYPVTVDEIYRFMDQPVTVQSLKNAIDTLVAEEKVYEINGFYSLLNDPSLVERRMTGNQRAAALLELAARIGKRLYKFPFVKGVGISGSLSKDFAEADADIDFFIITERNYLWLARTFLHALKKLSFLAGRQHWYCMNYFIDEDAFKIGEENVFTATEIVTLKPVAGAGSFNAFYEANLWTQDLLPNFPVMRVERNVDAGHWFKQAIEKVFRNKAGGAIDDFLMRVTSTRWRNKELQHKLNRKGNPMALIACKHFARPNPCHFQRNILRRYQDRVVNATQ